MDCLDCLLVQKIMLIDLVDQLMRPSKSPVSSPPSLLLVALAIRHGIACCNFHRSRTCKSSSKTSSWSNMLSLIMIIVPIACVFVCCYLHRDWTSGHRSWSSLRSIVRSFVVIFIMIKLACSRLSLQSNLPFTMIITTCSLFSQTHLWRKGGLCADLYSPLYTSSHINHALRRRNYWRRERLI